MFKIRDRYKLELQTTETMKLFSSTKKSIKKNRENVVLVQCNLVDNQCKQKSEV